MTMFLGSSSSSGLWAVGLFLLASGVAFVLPAPKRRQASDHPRKLSFQGSKLFAYAAFLTSSVLCVSLPFEGSLLVSLLRLCLILATLSFLGLHLHASLHVLRQPPLDPKRLKIAYFVEPSPFAHVSGLGSRYCNTIRCLKESGHDVLVLMPDDGRTESRCPETLGAWVVRLPSFRPFFYRSTNYTLTSGLSLESFQALKEFAPDVVHATSPGFIALGGILGSAFVGAPLVLAYHTHVPHYVPYYFHTRLMRFIAFALVYYSLRLFHNLAAAVTLCTSSVVQEELSTNGLQRVVLWERGVDTIAFSPSKASRAARRQLLGLKDADEDVVDNARLLLFVGRLAPEKNIPFLKDIVLELAKRQTQEHALVLSLIGDGPIRDQLVRHFADTEQVSQGKARVVFAGELRDEKLYEAFASGDVFLFSSETETLGFVVFEAMASGLPVVAPRAGGIPDLVEHGTTGFLYHPGDAADAARWIEHLFRSAEDNQRVRDMARREAEKWGWPSATEKLRTQVYLGKVYGL